MVGDGGVESPVGMGAIRARVRGVLPASLAGAGSLLLGALVLVGWTLRLPPLIQVLPGFVPMQFNTALGFTLSGGALLALVFERRRLAWVCGGTVGMLGGLTLWQYVAGVGLGIDELFMEHYITTLTTNPGRMAPTTAVAFVLCGGAVSLASWWPRRRWSTAALGVLSGLIAALGVGTLLAYLMGYQTPFSLSRHTYMAIHTSSGFALLGTGLFWWAWHTEMDGSPGAPWWVPVPAALTALTVFIAVGESLRVAEVGTQSASSVWVLWVLGPLAALAVTLCVHLWRVSWGRARSLEAALEDLQSETRRKKVMEERFRLAVEAAPAAMILCDERGRILFANERATAFFGWAVDDLVGRSVEMLVPEGSRAAHADLRAGYVANVPTARGMGGDRDLEGLRRDGSTFPAEVILNPIPSRRGTRILAAISDITERKRAEREAAEARADLEVKVNEVTRANAALLRSNRDLEQFAYVASHDLQEPLRMVASFTERVGTQYADVIDDEGRRMIGFAVDGARRMKALIDGLLQYSRLGSSGAAEGVVDAKELCDSVVLLFTETIRAAGATVTVGALPRLVANPVELELVFRNLIGNALKFTSDEPPRIEIGAAREGEYWRFHVDDNGIGVEAAYAEQIFQIFRRLHGRTAYPGEGMGLALCQRVVEQHDGRIWVSESRLGGASFDFTLPAAGDAGAPVAEAEARSTEAVATTPARSTPFFPVVPGRSRPSLPG